MVTNSRLIASVRTCDVLFGDCRQRGKLLRSDVDQLEFGQMPVEYQRVARKIFADAAERLLELEKLAAKVGGAPGRQRAGLSGRRGGSAAFVGIDDLVDLLLVGPRPARQPVRDCDRRVETDARAI